MTASLQLQEDILGLCLNREAEYLAVAGKLRAEHFPDQHCSAIWQTLDGLYKSGTAITDSLIETRTEWDANDVSLLAYLYRLRGNAPDDSGVHADDLAYDLVDSWYRAKFRTIVKDLPALADNKDVLGEDLVEEASKTLTKAFEQQQPSGLYLPSHFASTLERKAAGTIKPGEEVYTGFDPFDDMLAPLQPADVVVVGGATSSGKSSLVQLLTWRASETGTPVLFITNEMTGEQALQRMCSQMSGQGLSSVINFHHANNGEQEAIQDAARRLRNLPIFVDQSEKATVGQMRLKMMRYQRLEGVRLVIIDHLQFIRAENRRDSEYEQLAQITSDIKACAKELRLPIILVSHFNRGGTNRTNADALLVKDQKRPNMGDLHGSSSIEKDADAVLLVHRPEYWLDRNEPEHNHKFRDDWDIDKMKWKGRAELITVKRRQGKGYQRKTVKFIGESTLFKALGDEARQGEMI